MKLRSAWHSALTGYLIGLIAIVGSIAREQQLNTQVNHRTERIAYVANDRLCEFTRASWDERNAIVIKLTEHTTLPKNIDIGIGAKNLVTLVDRGNARKDRERTYLLDLQGKRPAC